MSKTVLIEIGFDKRANRYKVSVDGRCVAESITSYLADQFAIIAERSVEALGFKTKVIR